MDFDEYIDNIIMSKCVLSQNVDVSFDVGDDITNTWTYLIDDTLVLRFVYDVHQKSADVSIIFTDILTNEDYVIDSIEQKAYITTTNDYDTNFDVLVFEGNPNYFQRSTYGFLNAVMIIDEMPSWLSIKRYDNGIINITKKWEYPGFLTCECFIVDNDTD